MSAHLWIGDRCRWCEMHRDWEGSRHPCEGESVSPITKLHTEEKLRRTEENRRREELRRERMAADPDRAAQRRAQLKANNERCYANKTASRSAAAEGA